MCVIKNLSILNGKYPSDELGINAAKAFSCMTQHFDLTIQEVSNSLYQTRITWRPSVSFSPFFILLNSLYEIISDPQSLCRDQNVLQVRTVIKRSFSAFAPQ